jgi:hypothetical protein
MSACPKCGTVLHTQDWGIHGLHTCDDEDEHTHERCLIVQLTAEQARTKRYKEAIDHALTVSDEGAPRTVWARGLIDILAADEPETKS